MLFLAFPLGFFTQGISQYLVDEARVLRPFAVVGRCARGSHFGLMFIITCIRRSPAILR